MKRPGEYREGERERVGKIGFVVGSLLSKRKIDGGTNKLWMIME